MNKIKIKGIPFKLNGDVIEKGSTLAFKVVDRNNNDFIFGTQKGITIISVFPDINTRICDEQTQWIAKTAQLNKDIRFISFTKDPVNIINEWCLAKEIENVQIHSDVYGEFGEATNTLIKRIKKLARGFIVLKDNIIIDICFKKEITKTPEYELLSKYLN